jgi:hypothetical protein
VALAASSTRAAMLHRAGELSLPHCSSRLMARSKKSRRVAFEALRRLSDNRIDPEDSLAETFEFERATDYRRYADRAAALIVAAILEHALRTAILTHFVLDEQETEQMFSGITSPLATFSARIKIGYALGIYGPDMKSDLQTIEHIRNVFAHSRRHLDFSSPEIIKACGEFIFPTKEGDPLNWEPLFEKSTTERDIFITIAKFFFTFLMRDPGEKPLRYKDVPDMAGMGFLAAFIANQIRETIPIWLFEARVIGGKYRHASIDHLIGNAVLLILAPACLAHG